MISASQVKELREKTGAGMMDCKKVLTETDGDMVKAEELLRERGITKAAKKSGRIASEGLVASYISDDKKVGAIIEVNSETDFVAKNEQFIEFVNNLAKIVADENPADVEALEGLKYVGTDHTVKEELIEKVATIGENMTIRRFQRFESEGFVESYIHLGGKIAVLVDFKSGKPEVAKDVCMQIAAARPEFLNETEVPADRLEKEMEILKAQAINEGKPAEIAEKIVQGRVGKFYAEICLVDQEFVKDPSKKVKDYLKENNSEIVRFARFEKGEGLEKREENFADEVMKQLK